MPELIDRQAALKKMCETCGYCEKFEKAMRSTHPDFVTGKCNNYKFLAEQPTIEPGMNTAKIAKLCNDIEDVACDIARITMNDVISAESRMIFDKAKDIAAEISKQPEVRHGRWIRNATSDGYHCSNCGHHADSPIGEMIDPRDYECYLDKYCGGCGAQMYADGGTISKERIAEIMRGDDNG